MAQVSGGRHPAGRFAVRTIALIVGLIGSVIALVVNILYSPVHVLSQVAGVTSDSAHFFYGLVVVLVGVAGSFLAPILPILAAVMLAVAGVSFFFRRASRRPGQHATGPAVPVSSRL